MTVLEDERLAQQREGETPEDAEETGEETGEKETPTAEAKPKPTPPMQIPLPGLLESMGTDAGGRQPDRSEIRVLGGKMPINGEFSKGSEFDILVRVKVTGVLLQDTVDAFGTEGGTTRRHMARMISVRRVNLPSSGPGSSE